MRTLVSMLVLALLLVACAHAKNEKLEKAPNFAGDAQWIDTGTAGKNVPHSIKGYRGRVLLIDFWEYTCINCIRDFSVLKRWYAKYHSYGFDIVGVHYGEFAIGFSVDNVRDAAKRFQLPWPVVADTHGSIWNAYHSDVWPNRYLIDQQGDIVLHVEGEGNNRPMEEKIRELLATAHPEITQIPLDPPENTFAPLCGVCTDETYIGDWFGRGAIANPSGYKNDGEPTTFHADGEPTDGKVMLSGRWITQQDGVTSDDKARHCATTLPRPLGLCGSQCCQSEETRARLPASGRQADRSERSRGRCPVRHGGIVSRGEHSANVLPREKCELWFAPARARTAARGLRVAFVHLRQQLPAGLRTEVNGTAG